MILRHVRALTALTFLTLAVTASAGLAVSQAATTAPTSALGRPRDRPAGKGGHPAAAGARQRGQ